MKVTIYDIAREAGVSIGTVSRALNGKGKLSRETHERIRSVARRLNYQPSASARSLATRRTRNLMFLSSNIANIYFAELAKELKRVCREQDYRLFLGDSDEDIDIEAEYLRSCGDGSLDGLIVASLSSQANVREFRRIIDKRFPLVFLDTIPSRVPAPLVAVDDRLGIRLAVDYLYAQGHRRLAFAAGDMQFMTNQRRQECFFEALREKGLALHPGHCLVNLPVLHEDVSSRFGALLAQSERPTAVVAATDLTALACIHAAHEHELRVPEDLAITGFDDLSINHFLDIPLTTIAQPRRAIALAAVELVQQLIDLPGDEPFPAVREYLAPTLVIRKSA